MKVFVTGASGLLGNNIIRELVARNYEVQVLLRTNSNTIAFDDLPVRKIYGDIRNYDSLRNAIEQCDIIIHSAALTRMNAKKELYEEINVKGTETILRIASKLAIKKLIYVSTANVFGYGSKSQPGTELTPFAYSRLNSGYIQSKYSAMQLVIDQCKKNDFEIVQVAPTFLIGPFDTGPSSGKIILLGLKNRFVLCPPGGKNYIYVKDAAKAICNIIDSGKHGETYLLANENLTYTEFYKTLETVLNRKLIKVKIPKHLLLFIGLMGSLFEKILGTPLSLNYVNSKLLCTDNYYSGQKAIQELKLSQLC